MKIITLSVVILISFGLISYINIEAAEKTASPDTPKLSFTVPDYLIPVKEGLHNSINGPACSYVADQHLKGFVLNDDRAVAWLRSKHSGGAVPIRHFLSVSRVINDSYGMFFYDSDGDYVSVFKGGRKNNKGGSYKFSGWRNGVMVVTSKDGTIWSALSGRALEGPQKGKRLTREPSLLTQWGYWLVIHPESVAYDLFDGNRYAKTEKLPTDLTLNAKRGMAKVDARLPAEAIVLGVEGAGITKAFPLDVKKERDCIMNKVNGEPVVVFWYGRTKTAVAFRPRVGNRELTFYADKKATEAGNIAPESSPFRDRETKSQWTIAGRAVSGPLKGSELEWVASLQCRWYAWSAEYPETELFSPGHDSKLSKKK